jgi:hypothetical protein
MWAVGVGGARSQSHGAGQKCGRGCARNDGSLHGSPIRAERYADDG